MKVELKTPYADKNHSIHIMNSTDEVRQAVLSLMNFSFTENINQTFKLANPFLQGNTDDWMMIEFWTKNHDIILNAVIEFEKETGLSIDI